jgi:Tannase and feruloyl esterase
MAHLEHCLARLELLAGGRKLGQREAEPLRNQLAARIIGLLQAIVRGEAQTSSVEKQDPDLRSYFRLYMVPGVDHCRGGPGPDRADWITALEQWVENDTAPNEIIATKTDAQGAPTLERLLCPHPQERGAWLAGERRARSRRSRSMPVGHPSNPPFWLPHCCLAHLGV